MYLEHFELSDYPFIQSAKDEFFFETESGKKLTRTLHHWFEAGSGMMLLAGAAGVGRTSIARRSVASSVLDVRGIAVSARQPGALAFLQCIAYELGMPKPESELVPLLYSVKAHLKNHAATSQRTCLVLDDARYLDTEKSDILRALCIDHDLYLPSMLVLMVGDATVAKAITKNHKSDIAKGLYQVLAVKPMKEAETRGYMAHRLELVAQGKAQLFASTVVKAIHRQSGGNPAMINALCDKALMLAAEQKARQVSTKHLSVATSELGGVSKFKAGRTSARKLESSRATRRKPVLAVSAKPELMTSETILDRTLGKRTVKDTQLESSVHRLIRNVTTIGRAADCGIRINEEDISPYQALIVKTGNGMVIRNEGGQVPIYVNSTKVENATLREGDNVRIGSHELQVTADSVGEYSLVSKPAIG